MDNFPVRSPKRELSTAGFRTLYPNFPLDSWNPGLSVIHRTLEPPPNNRIKYIFDSWYQSPVLLSASLDNSMLRQVTPRASGMAQIHDLILNQGIGSPRPNDLESGARCRRCSFSSHVRRRAAHRNYACRLCHDGSATSCDPEETVLGTPAAMRLLLESGRTSATELIGLPYGSVARMTPPIPSDRSCQNPLARCRTRPEYEYLVKFLSGWAMAVITITSSVNNLVVLVCAG